MSQYCEVCDKEVTAAEGCCCDNLNCPMIDIEDIEYDPEDTWLDIMDIDGLEALIDIDPDVFEY